MLQQHAPAETHILPQRAIRDPFVLEFLELKDEYSESDFEEALINHLMDFMLELGDDFASCAKWQDSPDSVWRIVQTVSAQFQFVENKYKNS